MNLLAQRRKQYGIPAIQAHPLWDNVVLWRIPAKEEEETAGGIIIPQIAQGEVTHKGVLLAAGLKALDELYAYGIEIGDIVWFGRYAGDDRTIEERQAGQVSKKLASVLTLKSSELTHDEDLADRLAKGDLSIERDGDGVHCIETRKRTDQREAA